MGAVFLPPSSTAADTVLVKSARSSRGNASNTIVSASPKRDAFVPCPLMAAISLGGTVALELITLSKNFIYLSGTFAARSLARISGGTTNLRASTLGFLA